MKFSSFGKFILSGEHFVLYGVPTIALPWSSVRLYLERSAEPTLWEGADIKKLNLAWNLAREFFFMPPESGFPFSVESQIPIGAGFGSSAALCLCLLEAARVEAGAPPLSLEEKISKSRQLEDLFHGRSSGLDPAVIAYGRPISFLSGGEISPIQWNFPYRTFLLALSGKPRRTAEAVARVARFSEKFSDRFSHILLQMSKISQELLSIISSNISEYAENRAAYLGKLLHRNHQFLREVGVSSPELDKLVEASIDSGAWGAKLTGAGLGGGVLAYSSPSRVEQIRKSLFRAGAEEVYIYTIDTIER